MQSESICQTRLANLDMQDKNYAFAVDLSVKILVPNRATILWRALQEAAHHIAL